MLKFKQFATLVNQLHSNTCSTLKLYSLQNQVSRSFRSYSTKIDTHVATYEEVAESVNKERKIIIDVRNRDEIKSTGQIPSSVNIPLKNIQEVLGSMSEADFKRKYQRPKPSQSDEIIFYCKSGRRATEATNVALKLGYFKSKKFLAGWDGWASGKL